MATDGKSIVPNRSEVFEGHPELHHYTNLDGVVGIWNSQTIRATRFDCLNDTTEVSLFRDYLKLALSRSFIDHFAKQSMTNAKLANWVKSKGGVKTVATEGAEWFSESLYKTTYGENLRPSSNSFATPFISSFCSHCENDQEYERENGLLSQWRAYGRSTPCAIIFDTKALVDRLHEEKSLFGSFRQVVYSDESENAQKMFSPLIQRLINAWTAVDETTTRQYLEDSLAPFVNDSACFKHMAFSEENEVRIIAVPKTSHGVPAGDPENFSQHPLIIESHIASFDSASQRIRYRVHLFKSPTEKLPIQKIIVGPCGQQEAIYDDLQRLVDGRIQITKSKTPYLG